MPDIFLNFPVKAPADRVFEAVVTKFNVNNAFELKMTNADADWNGSKVKRLEV